MEGTAGDHPVNPSAKAGSPRAGYTGTHPEGFCPRQETPQPPWTSSSSDLPLSR